MTLGPMGLYLSIYIYIYICDMKISFFDSGYVCMLCPLTIWKSYQTLCCAPNILENYQVLQQQASHSTSLLCERNCSILSIYTLAFCFPLSFTTTIIAFYFVFKRMMKVSALSCDRPTTLRARAGCLDWGSCIYASYGSWCLCISQTQEPL